MGIGSSVDARSHFPRQTWALALHRGTMKQALAPISFTLLQCSAHLRFGSRVPLGRDERLGGRGGRAKACCDRGSGEDGFCRWVEGTGPRLPRLGARRRTDERRGSQALRAMVVGCKSQHYHGENPTIILVSKQ